MYEVKYYCDFDTKEKTAEFIMENEAIAFAMKVKGVVFQDNEILDNFSD